MNEQPTPPPTPQPQVPPEGNQPAPTPPPSQPQFSEPAAPSASSPASPLASPPPAQPARVEGADGAFNWDATEYVHQDKGGLWLLGYIGVVVILAGVAFFAVKSITFLLVIVAMGVALGVIAFRPPRIMHYGLSSQGLRINDKQYGFSDFRAFGVIHDGARFSVSLLPTKRLMPAVMVFFDEQQGEKIIDILGAHLPMQQLKESAIDTFLQRLRF